MVLFHFEDALLLFKLPLDRFRRYQLDLGNGLAEPR